MYQNEAMFLVYQQNRRLWRYQVVVADLAKPPGTSNEVLYTTAWMQSVELAESLALARYFPLYEFRQGFKHPHDPSRLPGDPEPDACVVTVRRKSPFTGRER